jgi:hypothetical protein
MKKIMQEFLCKQSAWAGTSILINHYCISSQFLHATFELGEYVIYYSLSQKLAGPPPEVALVVFHTHGPYSGMV